MVVAFSDVLEIINGRNQKGVESSAGQYPIYGSGGIMGRATRFLCPPNTVVIGRKGSINKPLYIEEPFWNVDTAFGLVPDQTKLLPRYLFYFCRYFDFEKLNTTVTIPSLTKANLLNIQIKLPSLGEQQYIVNTLNSINTLVGKREEEIKNFDNLIKARFVEMFGKADSNTRHYPVKPLSKISEYWNGLTYKPSDVVDGDNGTLVLRSSNIQNGSLSFDDNVFVNCYIKEKQYVKENDILMCSRNGSARLVGKVALIKGIEKPTSFGAFMMIIRSPYFSYLKVFFETQAFRSQLATGTTTINQITGNMLNNVMLPVPDIEAVKEFEKYVEQVDKSKVVEV